MDRLRVRAAELFEFSGASRNAAMEGLRAFAVILVFFVHYHSCFASWVRPGEATAELAYAIRWVGYIGVDLFFVLSGYLIYGSVLSKSFNYRRFLSRRVERIYPTFLVLLVLYVVLSFLAPGESKLPADPGQAIVYVVANALLLPGMLDIQPIITVAWTLSFEFFFYLVLPLFVAAFAIRRMAGAGRAGVFLCLAAVIVAMPLLGVGGYVQFLLFVSGMFVHEGRRKMAELQSTSAGKAVRGVSTVLAIATLPVAYALFTSLQGWGEPVAYVARTVWLFLALGVVVSVTLTEQGAVARACQWRPMRWLGNISYSYYLLHGLVLKVLATVLLRVTGTESAHPLAFWLLMPAAFVATLAGSAVLYLLVEKPLSLGTLAGAKPAAEARVAA